MNRRAVVLGAIAVIGIVALWWVFVFSPMGSDLDEAKEDLENARREGLELTAERNELQDLQDRSPELEADLAQLSAAIPESANQADFISGLNDIADESGITWQSVTMQEPTAGTPGQPPTIAVQISIEGGFFQALDYLNRLEDLERLVVVDSITVNSAGEEGTGDPTDPGSGLTGSDGDLSISLNTRIFSQSTLDTAPGTTTDPGTTNDGGTGTDDGVVN
jgi:Tfp pilus assembly protein PilO